MIDFDALDQNDPWNPDPLALGDRVRIRLSGECCYAGKIERHEPTTEGMIASVYDRTASYDGHTYLVYFQIPYVVAGTLHWAGQFARAELERIR